MTTPQCRKCWSDYFRPICDLWGVGHCFTWQVTHPSGCLLYVEGFMTIVVSAQDNVFAKTKLSKIGKIFENI